MSFMAIHGHHILIIRTDWTHVTMVNTATREQKVLNVSFDNMYLVFIKLKNIGIDDYNEIQPFITKMRYNSNKRKHEETEEKVDNQDDGYETEEVDYS